VKDAILFDIDGTLLYAKGLGRPAFAEAFAVAYGVPVDLESVSFVGATDTAIIRSLARTLGLDSTPEREERFFIELTKRLEPRLAANPLHIYPGVPDVLARLSAEGFELGIVTGNIRAIAWAKLIHGGLACHFSFGAYADDHADRDMLARLACERANARGLRPRLLVGDTPKDIQAAHAAGLPCLALASGWVGREPLAEAGADFILDSLGDVEAAFAAIREICRRG